MIREALAYISGKINLEFFTTNGSPSVILGNVTSLSDPGNTESNVLLSLVNIEEEVLLRDPENYFKRDPNVVYKNPPMHFNVTVIFGAYRPNDNVASVNYADSISNIQTIIGFFQRRYVFDRSDFPDLPAGIERLIFDLVSLNLEQLHHLWSMLGGKYIPSVVYKMRLVVIDMAHEGPIAPLITQIVLDDKIKFQQ
jgi:hypothetical protein